MTAALRDFKFFLSGGAGNTDPNAALGGIISSTAVVSQTGSMASMTGISILDAVANEEGDGTLAYNATTDEFTWTPPGGSAGAAVITTTNEEVTPAGAGTGAGYIRLDVTYASLPVSDASRTVTVANLSANLFDDVTKEQALAGLTEYRCVYLKNGSASSVSGATVWISDNTSGLDSIEIGLDPAGVGDGSSTGVATTIANEEAVPGGVTFSTPSSEGVALAIGSIPAGEAQAVWVKRIVPAGINVPTPEDVSRLRFRFLT